MSKLIFLSKWNVALSMDSRRKEKGKTFRLEGIYYRGGQRWLSRLILLPPVFFFFYKILLLKAGRNMLNENLNLNIKTHAVVTWFNKNPIRNIAHMQLRS